VWLLDMCDDWKDCNQDHGTDACRTGTSKSGRSAVDTISRRMREEERGPLRSKSKMEQTNALELHGPRVALRRNLNP
jgi:hypothetical protein